MIHRSIIGIMGRAAHEHLRAQPTGATLRMTEAPDYPDAH